MIIEKKAAIICIYKILEEYTDEDHYLTQTEIADLLMQNYEIEVERKSVSRYLSILEDLGFDIVKESRKGYSLYSRVLDLSEIRFINDAVFSSKSITGKQAISISEKLNTILSKYQRRNYGYIHKSSEISRTNNSDIFLNIEIIEEAIKIGKRVSFQYLTFDEKGKQIYRKDGYRYTVSPYYLINNFGKYYLLCNYNVKYQAIQTFRIDYMANIKIDEERLIKPLNSLPGMENFNITDYLNEHIYLFGDEVVDATVEVAKPDYIQQLDEWFGKKAKISNKDGKIYARIKCDKRSLFYWMLQYSEEFTLIKPESMVKELGEYLAKQAEKYKQK